MRRRIANGLTLLSAMLVGRSCFWADIVRFPIGQNDGGGVFIIDGRLALIHDRGFVPFFYSSHRAAGVRAEPDDKIWKYLWGVYWLGIGWGSIYWRRFLILPLWLLPLLTAISPVRWWRKRRREAGRGFPIEQPAATAASPR